MEREPLDVKLPLIEREPLDVRLSLMEQKPLDDGPAPVRADRGCGCRACGRSGAVFFLDKIKKCLRIEGLREIIALNVVNPQLLKHGQLLFGLHAFRDDF